MHSLAALQACPLAAGVRTRRQARVPSKRVDAVTHAARVRAASDACLRAARVQLAAQRLLAHDARAARRTTRVCATRAVVTRAPEDDARATSRAAASASPATPDLEALFPRRHAPLTPALLAYAPLGCALAAARMLLWALCFALDDPRLVDADGPLAFMITRCLGITTEWEGLERVPSGFHVAVSNHTCVGDFLLLYRQPRQYTHLIHAAVPTRGGGGGSERGGRHRVRFLQATPAAFKSLRRAAEAASATSPPPALRPVHLFPEGGMTSGAGLLQFSRGFALLRAPVVPIAFRCTHALGISTHTLTSSFAANLFWLCFVPTTSMRATVLPPMRQGAAEGDEAFAERVRAALAAELNVPMLQVGIREKYAIKEAARAMPSTRPPL